MGRSRYWKLTPDEVEKFTYPEDKLLNWDMKCIREPEEEARFIGVFSIQTWDSVGLYSNQRHCVFS